MSEHVCNQTDLSSRAIASIICTLIFTGIGALGIFGVTLLCDLTLKQTAGLTICGTVPVFLIVSLWVGRAKPGKGRCQTCWVVIGCET